GPVMTASAYLRSVGRGCRPLCRSTTGPGRRGPEAWLAASTAEAERLGGRPEHQVAAEAAAGQQGQDPGDQERRGRGPPRTAETEPRDDQPEADRAERATDEGARL